MNKSMVNIALSTQSFSDQCDTACVFNYIGCAGNVIDDIGTCADGYIEVDCCDCDTTGNDTVAFYKDDQGKCRRKL